ncbi:hypothetical protein EXIGLDRAFT_610959 [Exidia glandulosa HHB12029]|uniref:Glycosyltransferase 61 catalytic domain-containing protein n=1 Tax=Exidia glandulosa HHB12029 TaxID=1314781 RepID=A0A166ATQ7_EXIGL|nr:hypothetical protein EXIGLDRAFT_610959 [Exidia glandulosa HHB12029]
MPAPGSWVPNSTGSVAVDDAAAVNPYPDFAAPKQSNKPVAKPPPAVNDFKASRGGHSLPVTRLIAHAPGWTIFENLYMSNGTLFVLTDEDQSRWPQIRLMTSTGLPAENTPENIQAREPTKDNMDFLGPYEARKRWSGGVWGVEGTTFLFNEPAQFIAHYYHGCAELLFGAWSFYAGTYDPHITERGETTVPPVTRAIFTHSEANRWRDGSRFNAYFLYSAFPSISLEGQEDWDDRIFMTRNGQRAWVFERVMLTDRSASFRGEFCGGRNQRIASEAYEAVKDRASKWWWEPMRRSVLKFAGVEDDIMDLSLRYNSLEKPKPVISYISRQAGGRRMLIEKDHEGLVAAVQKMADQRGWEFNVVNAQHMTQEEQILMAARTTVMLGVHGNGLTHLLHMAQTPVSTVIEIFYPGGFAHDYEWTTLALGMKHFAVWNDTYYAEPNAPNVDYPDGKNDDGGFQGNHIPVYGPAVAQLIADRLDGKLP